MNKPAKPTTCDISDLLNGLYQFVNDNPTWPDDEACVARIGMAYMIITKMADMDMVTDEECDFLLNIHETIKEITTND